MRQLVIGLLLSIFVAGPALAEDKVYKIGGTEYPISTFSENGKILGLDYEIVEAILKEIGITHTKRVIAPWERVLLMLDNKEVDLVVPMVYSKEREEKYNLAPSIRPRYNIIYLNNKVTKQVNTIADLKGLKVGICRGYAYQSDFMDAIKNKLFAMDESVDNEQALIKLAAGRFDAFMLGEDTALYLIKKNNLKGKLKKADYRAEKTSNVGINKADVDLYEKFVQGYEIAKKKGIIDKVIDKWMIDYAM